MFASNFPVDKANDVDAQDMYRHYLKWTERRADKENLFFESAARAYHIDCTIDHQTS